MYRFALFAALLNVHAGLRWTNSVPDQTVVTTCVGSDIQLPWNFTLSPGERVEDIKWTYQAEGRDDELIAIFASGYFSPMPAFSGRVQRMGDSGIVISKAALMESGNYSVVVSTEDSSNHLGRFQRTVYVQIVDSPQTESGKLHVQQSAGAVYDNTTGEWRIQLTCGVFSYSGHPAVDVVWTNPEGQQLQSSSVHNGTFYLLVPNPPSGGNYTCTLPPLSLATRCLPPLSPLLEGATVAVDDVKASFTLLAAKQDEIQTRTKLEIDALKTEIVQIKNENKFLQTQLETATKRASFQARLSSDFTGTGRLYPFTVTNNEGNAFNGTTGIFTATVNGTYVFVGSSMTYSSGKWVYMELQKEGTVVSYAYAYASSSSYPMGVCHAVVHLSVGERVWLQSTTSSSYYYTPATTFTGFLISADD